MTFIKRLGLITTTAFLACSAAPLLGATPKPAEQSAHPAKSATATRQMEKLAADYYLFNARFEPLYATYAGDNRFDDELGLGIAPSERARRLSAYRGFARRLKAIAPSRLGAADRISYDIMAYELRTALDMASFPDHLMPVNQMGSIPMDLAVVADGKGALPLSTPKHYDNLLRRLVQLTPWIDQAIANMREGIGAGVVLPKSLIVPALPQYRDLATTDLEKNPFYAGIKNLPENFSDADKARITKAYQSEITSRLQPALARLAAFLEKEYMPAGRATSGLADLPDGAKWYQQNIVYATTTQLTPEAIHAMGLAEVARIQQQFAVVGPKMGYQGPAAELPKWVARQSRYMPFKDDREVLEVYRKLDVAVASKLPALFTLVPKSPLEQRLEPELTRATASDHYTGPSTDGKRPGIFWSVVNDATAYDRTKMTSLYLHEGRPGHHFQIALQVEKSLPDFRRFGGNNAFIEGWALYAETLGSEMGLYEEPDQYFGHLNSELLRAARLVVDTGLHAKGWTRERAIDYLKEVNGYTDQVATSAIERYMAWPAQALGYKVGALKIQELRKRAEAAFGQRFSLPAFHAVVIGDGSLPLAVLERKVDRWITEAK
ncbi:DUF885 domain-containing protein [Pseudoduganella umbonata]|uniref:DUF885 domain-containing protein n=1 Tax=Pseudoduganella umbonata TaxID=864828 RepID=A0A4P8HRZ1_9BURK|nr:DUF885 domain-containing protein [Pseudoduganella umbonata]MBB3222394.1 uncharacterized protein (DUF885 family) [Pseudoduganella umbonata]QCP12607.1 DUF885 domain-containing protein [Pseudoduganella umbonata]